MRLGIDLDGVVADFNGGWMKLYNEEFGAELTPDLVTTWDGLYRLTHMESMHEFWRWARGTDRPSIFRHLDPFPGALETLRELSRNHAIVIMTTKPNWAVSDTYAWIADTQLPTREVHITARKYRINCDVYLEDAPHQLHKLVEERRDRIVCRFVRPWNRPVAGSIEIETWDEFAALVHGHAE